VELDPRAVEATMGEALALVMAGSTISVRVCPADAEVARAVLGPIMQRLGVSGDVELVEEGGLQHGSCVVRSQSGCIDATIDAMIERMVEQLLPDGRRLDSADAEAVVQETNGVSDRAANGTEAVGDIETHEMSDTGDDNDDNAGMSEGAA